MVNYYELLEIPQNADPVAIRAAVKKTRRLWNNRANNPDATIRAEAERHVKEIAEAEKILLDAAKREEYDRQLAMNPQGNTLDQPQQTSPSNWEDDFWPAYENGMNDYAAQIAQRAINANERDGRAWFLYGEALRRGGDIQRGIPALERAEFLIPDEPGVYRQLAYAYMDAERPGDALQALFKATDLDPHNSEYYSMRAYLYRMAGMFEESRREAQTAFRMTPDDNSIRFEYFYALYGDALEAMSYNRSSGKHLITNKVQLDYVNEILKIMAETIPDDANKEGCLKDMQIVVDCVVQAESMVPTGFFGKKLGYIYNYETSNADTRSSGKR